MIVSRRVSLLWDRERKPVCIILPSSTLAQPHGMHVLVYMLDTHMPHTAALVSAL